MDHLKNPAIVAEPVRCDLALLATVGVGVIVAALTWLVR